jgi:hypothetical protein
MRAKVGLAITLVCAAAASVALAGSAHLPASLDGDIEHDGVVNITIRKDRVQDTPGERYRWEFSRLRVICEGEERHAKRAVLGGFWINARYGGPGDWGTQTVKAGDERDPSYAWRVSGQLVSWDKAKGWLRIWGNDVLLSSGGRAECDSGRLHWVALR